MQPFRGSFWHFRVGFILQFATLSNLKKASLKQISFIFFASLLIFVAHNLRLKTLSLKKFSALTYVQHLPQDSTGKGLPYQKCFKSVLSIRPSLVYLFLPSKSSTAVIISILSIVMIESLHMVSYFEN